MHSRGLIYDVGPILLFCVLNGTIDLNCNANLDLGHTLYIDLVSTLVRSLFYLFTMFGCVSEPRFIWS